MVETHRDINCKFCGEKLVSIDFDEDKLRYLSVSFKCNGCNKLNNVRINSKVGY